MLGFLKPFLTPLYGWIAAGAIALGIGLFLWGDHHGARREHLKLVAYQSQVHLEIANEKARQQREFAEATAVLQTQLDQKEASADLAWDVAARLQAEVDAGPKIEGRGATVRDVEVLNAR